MSGRQTLFEEFHVRPEAGGEERELSTLPCGGAASYKSSFIGRLLMAEWGDCWGKPLTVDELLVIGMKVFEPLFHEPRIGPIPEYLITHSSVYACVAEYEDKLEELDRWKACQLNHWLKDMVGGKWSIAGEVYELRTEIDTNDGSERYWFRQIEDCH